jgi:pSer/pThr/pTyr-binding forkhead associated (FHA) protein
MADDMMPEPPIDEAAAFTPEMTPPASSASIVLKRSGAETDISFSVNPPAVIGRFDPTVGPIDIDLGGLPEGTYISRRHAKIDLENGVYTLTDQGSSNGSFTLGASDFERHDSFELHDGTEFALGNARFVFHCSEAAHAEPPAADADPHDVPSLEPEPAPETV